MANGQSNRDKNERELWEETCQDLFDTALLQYKSSSPMLQKYPQKLYKVMDLFFSHNIFQFPQKLHY